MIWNAIASNVGKETWSENGEANMTANVVFHDCASEIFGASCSSSTRYLIERVCMQFHPEDVYT